jgi:hypothetical protein
LTHLIFSLISINQMAHDGSHKSNNGDNNNIENSSSMLEHLLIIQAQLLQTVQQVMVQMQDINQRMQSMEVRPSSRKRKSNTQDDVGQPATQNPKGKKCYNHGLKGHFALQCPKPRTHAPLTLSSTSALQPNPQAKGKEEVHLKV